MPAKQTLRASLLTLSACALAIACTTRDELLAGKSCADMMCAAGYTCDLSTDQCVRDGHERLRASMDGAGGAGVTSDVMADAQGSASREELLAGDSRDVVDEDDVAAANDSLAVDTDEVGDAGLSGREGAMVDAGSVASGKLTVAGNTSKADETSVDQKSVIAKTELTSCEGDSFDQVERLEFDTSERSLWSPSLTSNGLVLYYSRAIRSDYERIFFATRADSDSPFENPTEVAELSVSNKNGNPFISADGLSIYFYSDRDGGRHLNVAKRQTLSDSFGEPSSLSELWFDSGDVLPWVSDDELTIYYTKSKGADWTFGSGLFVARRESKSVAFGLEVAVVGINETASLEDAASLSSDGLRLYFASDRNSSDGNRDLFGAERSGVDDNFANVQSLHALNSDADDTDLAFSADGTEVFFSSDRDGARSLWHARVECD